MQFDYLLLIWRCFKIIKVAGFAMNFKDKQKLIFKSKVD